MVCASLSGFFVGAGFNIWGMNYFPEWNPQRYTASKFSHSDKNIRLKALRNSSGAFIKRIDVREYIFKRDGYKCMICKNKNQLTVDHIISVKKACDGLISIRELNRKQNLQTLCTSCNSRKAP